MTCRRVIKKKKKKKGKVNVKCIQLPVYDPQVRGVADFQVKFMTYVGLDKSQIY